jgi:hypothetical protein
MSEQESRGRVFARQAGSFFGHVAAIIVGLIVMVVGVAMGVTIVLLPVGLAIGLGGLLLFGWGLLGYTRSRGTRPPPDQG